MKFVGRIGMIGAGLAAASVLASGAALAHSRQMPITFGKNQLQVKVVTGAYVSGSVASLLTNSAIEIQSRNGKDTTVYLTSSTRVAISAQGTAGDLLNAVGKKELMVMASVEKKQGHWVAISVSARLDADALPVSKLGRQGRRQ